MVISRRMASNLHYLFLFLVALLQVLLQLQPLRLATLLIFLVDTLALCLARLATFLLSLRLQLALALACCNEGSH